MKYKSLVNTVWCQQVSVEYKTFIVLDTCWIRANWVTRFYKLLKNWHLRHDNIVKAWHFSQLFFIEHLSHPVVCSIYTYIYGFILYVETLSIYIHLCHCNAIQTPGEQYYKCFSAAPCWRGQMVTIPQALVHLVSKLELNNWGILNGNSNFLVYCIIKSLKSSIVCSFNETLSYFLLLCETPLKLANDYDR